jgi:2-polyprenyl-3-methyl-5-hydroxy-6-metoxy-1,4-benzoquinol methylase
MISEDYREMQKELHKNPNYGVASVSYAPLVSEVINKTRIGDILDYGAGKGRLAQNLTPDHEVAVHHYEPAIDEWANTPEAHDLVACIDVLEHIEPDHLDEVLDDLKRVTKHIGVFTVHTGPAAKTLPDGRNAHLIQEPMEWWLPKFMERFEIYSLSKNAGGFWIIVNKQ